MTIAAEFCIIYCLLGTIRVEDDGSCYATKKSKAIVTYEVVSQKVENKMKCGTTN